MGLSFTVSTVVLAIGLFFNGSYSAGVASTSLLMLLPALIGVYGGQFLRQKLSPPLFRKCFLWSLIALGLHMIVHEAWAR